MVHAEKLFLWKIKYKAQISIKNIRRFKFQIKLYIFYLNLKAELQFGKLEIQVSGLAE